MACNPEQVSLVSSSSCRRPFERRRWMACLSVVSVAAVASCTAIIGTGRSHAGEVAVEEVADAAQQARGRLWGTPRLILQSHLATPQEQEMLSWLGVKNDVISVSQHWLIASQDDQDMFLNATPHEVRLRRNRFFDMIEQAHGVDLNTWDGILVFDIESPHPNSLSEMIIRENGSLRAPVAQRVADAFAMRVTVWRERAPDARYAFYSTLSPHSRGSRDNPSHSKTLAAMQALAARGMFDQIDLLSPLLYLRFGEGDTGYETIEKYTRLGIEDSRKIRRSTGESIPLFPMLSFKVFNWERGTQWKDHCAVEFDSDLNNTLGLQINILKEMNVPEYGVWNGRFELGCSARPGMTAAEVFDILVLETR